MAISTTDNQYILDAIATQNVDLIKGIAETTTLTDETKRAMLFSGSLEVAVAVIKSLPVGSALFAEIAKRAVTVEEITMGKTVNLTDANGLLNPFTVQSNSCGEAVLVNQEADERYAKDNIARVVLDINLDGIDNTSVTLENVIVSIEKALLSNIATDTDVVTPFLESSLDALKAAAFVHPNTDNAMIVSQMTLDDENGLNIDGFKTAMINLLTTDTMIQGNAEIVAYLLGATQNAPVRYTMFKNYLNVVLNGGSIVAGLDVTNLIASFVK
jgi:hypothetical protein